MIYVQYAGGLGSIQENDNIFVKGLLWSNTGRLYSDSISDSNIEDSKIPISKAPGFDVILGLVSVIFIWVNVKKKNI